MMMIPILDKTLRVAVERVKFKRAHNIIKTTSDIILIEPYLYKDISTIIHILPTLASKGLRFPYTDGDSLQRSIRHAVKATIGGSYERRLFLLYLRRIYIGSGLAVDEEDFCNKIKEMWQLAKYAEANKNEI